jgi:hypothetical protein
VSGLLKGGGRDDCELRSCADARALSDCSECGEFGDCSHDVLLKHMRSGAVRAGLFVREPGSERAATLRYWLDELRSRWPQSVLFDDQKDRW